MCINLCPNSLEFICEGLRVLDFCLEIRLESKLIANMRAVSGNPESLSGSNLSAG